MELLLGILVISLILGACLGGESFGEVLSSGFGCLSILAIAAILLLLLILALGVGQPSL